MITIFQLEMKINQIKNKIIVPALVYYKDNIASISSNQDVVLDTLSFMSCICSHD